jgi:hypothetical protein
MATVAYGDTFGRGDVIGCLLDMVSCESEGKMLKSVSLSPPLGPENTDILQERCESGSGLYHVARCTFVYTFLFFLNFFFFFSHVSFLMLACCRYPAVGWRGGRVTILAADVRTKQNALIMETHEEDSAFDE